MNKYPRPKDAEGPWARLWRLRREQKAIRKQIVAEQMCLRKKPFASQAAADKRAGEIGLRSYQCPICKGWHLAKRRKK